MSVAWLSERMAQWRDQGVTLALINSNATESVEEMRDMADAYELTCPVLQVPSTRVLYTIVGGKVVYERKE